MLIYYLPPQVNENLWHGVQASVFFKLPRYTFRDEDHYPGLSLRILCQIYTLLCAKAGLRFILTENRSQLALFRAMIVSYPFSSCGFCVAGLWTLPQTTQPSSLNICCFKDSTELNFLKGEERLTVGVTSG